MPHRRRFFYAFVLVGPGMLSGLCELNVVFGSVPRWDLAFMAQMQREKSTRGGISLQLADFVPCKKGITFFRVMGQTVIRARLRMHYARRVSITSPVMMDTI